MNRGRFQRGMGLQLAKRVIHGRIQILDNARCLGFRRARPAQPRRNCGGLHYRALRVVSPAILWMTLAERLVGFGTPFRRCRKRGSWC